MSYLRAQNLILLLAITAGGCQSTSPSDDGTADAGSVTANADANEPTGTVTVTEAESGSTGLPLDQGDEVTVDVPAGAVEESTDVELAPVDPEVLPEVQGGASLAATPVAFTPHGTSFSVPFTIAGASPQGPPWCASTMRPIPNGSS